MDKTKRIRILLTLLILVLSLSAALILIKENSKNSNSVEVTNKSGKKEIGLSWWGNDERHDYTMEAVDHFQEQNPDIKVSYRYGEWNGYEKRTRVWMRSHNETDVMQINYAWLEEYSKDGAGFYDLNRLSDQIDLNAFTDVQRGYGMKNGKLNALPIAMNAHIFYYNQDLLDEYGLDLPNSWGDLFAMAKVLQKDDKYVLGMSKKQVFFLLVAYYEQSTGNPAFSQDGKIYISKEEMADLLVFYKRLLDEGVLCPIDKFERSTYFSGKVAGTMCWISDSKVYCDEMEEQGVTVSRCLYPRVPDAKRSGWYVKPATMWAISADTKHPEEAARLLDFLVNDPYMIRAQGTEKGVPVSSRALDILSKEGLQDTNEYLSSELINEHSDEMSLIILNMEREEVIDAFKQGSDEYIYNKTGLEEAAEKIIRNIRGL